MKTTKYFDSIGARPDRAYIKEEWIIFVIENPEKEFIQSDGRIRRWGNDLKQKALSFRAKRGEDPESRALKLRTFWIPASASASCVHAVVRRYDSSGHI